MRHKGTHYTKDEKIYHKKQKKNAFVSLINTFVLCEWNF
ncbi:hypothetical protein FH5_00420 [Priestia endophytica]|nr:hypothetical protein FH5_00420 [Priestia endophytica]